jgi:hypothetical protein
MFLQIHCHLEQLHYCSVLFLFFFLAYQVLLAPPSVLPLRTPYLLPRPLFTDARKLPTNQKLGVDCLNWLVIWLLVIIVLQPPPAFLFFFLLALQIAPLHFPTSFLTLSNSSAAQKEEFNISRKAIFSDFRHIWLLSFTSSNTLQHHAPAPRLPCLQGLVQL